MEDNRPPKPDPLLVKAENVPEKMTRCDQWLCWRYEWRCNDDDHEKYCERTDCDDGEWSKMPRQPNGKPAKSNDESTWSSFEAVIEAYDDTDFDGIGFVFDGDLVGFDFDDCYNPDHPRPRETLVTTVGEIVSDLDSYTEYSPSKTGYHTIVEGSMPENYAGNRADLPHDEDNNLPESWEEPHLEIYDKSSRRYFTVTGHTVAEQTEIEERDDLIDEIHETWIESTDEGDTSDDFETRLDDSEIVEKAKKAKNGSYFADLYNGDWERHTHRWDGSSHSEARMAFAEMLAFWCAGDETQMIRIFKQSDLCRSDDDIRCFRDYEAPKAARRCDEYYGDDNLWYDQFNSWYFSRVNDDDTLKQREIRQRLTNALDDAFEFRARTSPGDEPGETPLYRYDASDGYYKKDGDQFIGEQLETKVNCATDDNDAKKVAYKIRCRNLMSTDEFSPAINDDSQINFSNGVYDRKTGELIDHDSDFAFTRQIPWDYDSEASEPDEILSFIDEITGREKDATTLLEWIGFTLKPEYDPEKFLLLTGEGRNGKSIYFDILAELHGGPTSNSGNVSSVELQEITGGSRFGFSRLEGSLVNIDGDVAGGSFSSENLSKLKKMTGNDYLKIEEKHQPSYEAKNRAKLAFAANEPPRFNERSSAIDRRLLWIKCPHKFTEDGDKDPVPKSELKNRLINSEQISGLIKVALQALDRLEERGEFACEVDSTAEERRERYDHDADPIASFVSTCLEERADDSLVLPKNAVYGTFENYVMDKMGSKNPTAKNTFYRKFGNFIDYDTGQVSGQGDERPRVVKGVWFTDDAAEYIPDVARESIKSLYWANNRLNSNPELPTTEPSETELVVAGHGHPIEINEKQEKRNKIYRVLSEIHTDRPISSEVLCHKISEQTRMTADEVEDLLPKMKREGQIIEQAGGKLEPA